MPSVLIVGGTGFLGAELIRRSQLRGSTVHSTRRSRPLPDDLESACAWHHLDVTDADATTSMLRALDPDLVINTAYQQTGPDAAAINHGGAATIAKWCAAAGRRFVHLSTDLVFDGTLGRRYAEDDEPSPIMEYGRTKLDGERAVLDADPSALVVRTSIIYGARHAPQEQLVVRAATDPGFAFFTDECRSPVHVTDLADAVLDLANGDADGLLHLGSDSRIDRLTFAQLLAADLGVDAAALQGRPQDPAMGHRPADVSLDSGRASTILGRSLPGPAERLGQASTSDSS